MENKDKQISIFKDANQVKLALAGEYKNQIKSLFSGDENKALKFLSNAVSVIQKNPALLECTPTSLINSLITTATFGFMPSSISGEAYILPYKNSSNGTIEAQFQLGYQGIITLFYRSGVKEIVCEHVCKTDKFVYDTGKVVKHEIDPFSDRGERLGTYAIIRLINGGELHMVMSTTDIVKMAARFSKSYQTKSTPWKEENDPNGWMHKKTVLRQIAKLVPKSEQLLAAIAEDDKDSNIEDQKETGTDNFASRMVGALEAGENLKTKNLNGDKDKENKEPEADNGSVPAEGDEVGDDIRYEE